MPAMKILSPAKINLFLEVLRKRKDGYHEIETLFERINLCDEIVLTSIPSGIEVELNFDPRLRGDDGRKLISTGPVNLAYRAAKILKDKFKIKKGIHIRIKKRIPVSAGLGGGSSNAAAVLLGLNRLWKLRLSKKKLLRLAAELGSDVPFFVLETPFALGTGRGEVLKRAGNGPATHASAGTRGRSLRKIWHVIVKPAFGISTKKAYQALAGNAHERSLRFLTGKATNVKMLFRSIQDNDSGALSRLLRNTLELALNKRVTSIFRIKDELKKQGALAALMSGSGSSVFGIFRTRERAQKAASELKTNKKFQVFVVSTFTQQSDQD